MKKRSIGEKGRAAGRALSACAGAAIPVSGGAAGLCPFVCSTCADEALAARASAGDRAAQGELYLRWFPKLVRFIGGQGRIDLQDCQDIATETLYRVCTQRHWDPAGQSFPAFVYRSATNGRYDHIRRRNTDPIGMGSAPLPVNDAPPKTRSSLHPGAASEISDAEVGRWGHFEIARAIESLDANTRTILNLRHQERLDWEDIGLHFPLVQGGDPEKAHRRAVNTLRWKLRARGFDLRVSQHELSVIPRHLAGAHFAAPGGKIDPVDWASSLVEDAPEVVRRCLAELDPVAAIVLVMRALGGMEWDAIADALPDMDETAARRTHQEARKRLSGLVAAEGYLFAPGAVDGGFRVVAIDKIEANFSSKLLMAGFRTLSYIEQTILFLIDYQETGVVECAEILGISIGNVSTKHKKALETLSNFLKNQDCHDVPLNAVLPSSATVLEEFGEERLVRCSIAEPGPRFEAYLDVLLHRGYDLLETKKLTGGAHVLVFYREKVLLAPARNLHIHKDDCEQELSEIQREHQLDVVPSWSPGGGDGIVEHYQDFVLRDNRFLAAMGGAR